MADGPVLQLLIDDSPVKVEGGTYVMIANRYTDELARWTTAGDSWFRGVPVIHLIEQSTGTFLHVPDKISGRPVVIKKVTPSAENGWIVAGMK